MSRFTPRAASTGPKPFTWSYSKLKNYEACALKHQKVDLDETYAEPPSEQLEYGNYFHDMMKKAVRSGTPLPEALKSFQPIVNKLTRVSNPDQFIETELKLAITRDMKPTGFFAKDVWFRGVLDYLKRVPTGNGYQIALAVDYKTGKLLDDPVQLGLFSQMVMSHYPRTILVRTEYFWTNDMQFTREDFTTKDMLPLWTELLPRVAAMERSYNSGVYEPHQSGLCKRYCPVVSCEHNGRYGQ